MNELVVRPYGAVSLPDNDQWEMRFEIRSESSNRKYVIARNKKTKQWGCSCPGYLIHRTCKHLKSMGLPTNEKPFNVTLQIGQ